jgi:hypothetical protein
MKISAIRENYYNAKNSGYPPHIDSWGLQEVVDHASQIKQGAHLALKNNINDIMGLEEQYDLPCRGQSDSSCSG